MFSPLYQLLRAAYLEDTSCRVAGALSWSEQLSEVLLHPLSFFLPACIIDGGLRIGMEEPRRKVGVNQGRLVTVQYASQPVLRVKHIAKVIVEKANGQTVRGAKNMTAEGTPTGGEPSHSAGHLAALGSSGRS